MIYYHRHLKIGWTDGIRTRVSITENCRERAANSQTRSSGALSGGPNGPRTRNLQIDNLAL